MVNLPVLKSSGVTTVTATTTTTTTTTTINGIDTLTNRKEKKLQAKQDSKNKSGQDRATLLRRNVFARLPKNYQMSHYYYIRNYISFALYLACFILSLNFENYWYELYMNSSDYYSLDLYVYGVLTYVISPFIFGLFFLLYIGMGHDAIHDSFGPPGTRLGKFLNWFVRTATWDGVGAGFHSADDHHFHHKYTHTKEDNTMMLISMKLGMFGEVLHTILYTIILANIWDVCCIFSIPYGKYYQHDQRVRKNFYAKHKNNKMYAVIVDLLHRVWMSIVSVNRVLLTLGAVYSADGVILRPVLAFMNLFWGAYFMNWVFYGSHVDSIDNQDTSDMYLYHMNHAWESYSKQDNWYNRFQQWLHTGGSAHVSHHCFTYVPRSLICIVSEEIEKVYGNELRRINSFSTEWKIWHNRHTYQTEDDIPISKVMMDKLQ